MYSPPGPVDQYCSLPDGRFHVTYLQTSRLCINLHDLSRKSQTIKFRVFTKLGDFTRPMKILEPQCDVLLNHCRKLRTRPFEGALRSISNWRKLRTRPFERAPRGQSTVAVWRRSDGPLVLRKTVTVTVNFLTLSQVRDSPDNSFIDFFSRSSRVALQPPPCFFSIQSICFLILSLSLFPLRVILSLSPLSLTPPCHNTSSLRPSFSCSFSSFSSRHCQPS